MKELTVNLSTDKLTVIWFCTELILARQICCNQRQQPPRRLEKAAPYNFYTRNILLFLLFRPVRPSSTAHFIRGARRYRPICSITQNVPSPRMHRRNIVVPLAAQRMEHRVSRSTVRLEVNCLVLYTHVMHVSHSQVLIIHTKLLCIQPRHQFSHKHRWVYVFDVVLLFSCEPGLMYLLACFLENKFVRYRKLQWRARNTALSPPFVTSMQKRTMSLKSCSCN